MTQQNLPFDKRDYHQRMVAIETMKSKLLSARQLGRVRFLAKYIFKSRRSSYEGVLTFVQADAPKRYQFSLADDLQLSGRTLSRHLNWAEQIGVLERAIDCDDFGDRRTTVSINWRQVASLAGVEFAQNQADRNVEQTDKNAEQADRNAEQTDRLSVSTKPNTKEPKSQPCGGDFESLLASVGIGDRNVVTKAIDKGATAADCLDVLHSAIRHQVPAGIAHGRLMAIGGNPDLTSKPWPAAIAAAQRLRESDRHHYREKQRRREAIEQVGHTANSESIADVLCADIEGVQAAAELERLEIKFGSQWDGLTPDQQAKFAENALDSFSFGRWAKDRSRCRMDLLTELERTEQSAPRILTGLQQQ